MAAPINPQESQKNIPITQKEGYSSLKGRYLYFDQSIFWRLWLYLYDCSGRITRVGSNNSEEIIGEHQ